MNEVNIEMLCTVDFKRFSLTITCLIGENFYSGLHELTSRKLVIVLEGREILRERRRIAHLRTSRKHPRGRSVDP